MKNKHIDQHGLNYTVVVMGPAYGTQAATTAYQFVSSLVSTSVTTSHRIEAVFFYYDGVYNANQFTDPANDEFDLVSAWQQLAKQHNIKLALCVSAALRRGIIENKNIAEHFQLSGLSELSESLSKSDRVIEF